MVVDPFLLILSLIIVALLILGNIYFIAYYSHYADTEFGNSIPVKMILVSQKKFKTLRFLVTCLLSAKC